MRTAKRYDGPNARSNRIGKPPDRDRIARTSSSKCTNLARREPGIAMNATCHFPFPETPPRRSFLAARCLITSIGTRRQNDGL